MKALRQHAQKDIRLEDIPEPTTGADKVKIKVKWCGICGSDIHEWDAGPLAIRTTKPHPSPGSKTAPVVIGHEFSGDVVEVGNQVKNINSGDRVIVRPTVPCYECYWCKKGNHIQCAVLGSIGFVFDGGFAEYVEVPGHCVFKIPDTLGYEAASFVEPLACGVHAIKRSGMLPGDSVAIIGAGPIGLLTMQAAKACGAGSIFVIETLSARSELALKLGATEVFNPEKVNVGKEIAKLTGGIRADIAFECAGPAAAMVTALKVTGKGGKIIEVGQMIGSCDFPFPMFWMHEKTIIATQGYVDEIPAAISFLADKKVDVEPMITGKIKLQNIIQDGFEALSGEERFKHIKIIVSPE